MQSKALEHVVGRDGDRHRNTSSCMLSESGHKDTVPVLGSNENMTFDCVLKCLLEEKQPFTFHLFLCLCTLDVRGQLLGTSFTMWVLGGQTKVMRLRDKYPNSK